MTTLIPHTECSVLTRVRMKTVVYLGKPRPIDNTHSAGAVIVVHFVEKAEKGLQKKPSLRGILYCCYCGSFCGDSRKRIAEET